MKGHKDNLVFVDCEMTGLEPFRLPSHGLDFKPDRIIEVAVIVTTPDLNPLDEGISVVIHTSDDVLRRMNDWCQVQHGKTGLTEECRKSEISMEQADGMLYQYVRERTSGRPMEATLAGGCVWTDKLFIQKDLPLFHSLLYYETADTSTFSELFRRLGWPLGEPPKWPESTHRAMQDVIDTIEEMRWYTDRIQAAATHAPPSIRGSGGSSSLELVKAARGRQH